MFPNLILPKSYTSETNQLNVCDVAVRSEYNICTEGNKKNKSSVQS